MSDQSRCRSIWLSRTIIGFIISEWQAWRKEQMQPCFHLAAMPQESSALPPYPLDMEPLLALPFGTLDEAGVPYNFPTNKYPAAYHPTTIAQYGLANWNTYLTTGDEKYREAFIIQARWLIEHALPLVSDTVGWPMPFAAHEYSAPEQWLSALTQGNAISVLVRAYRLTNEDIFLHVARRAIRTFERDIRDGGVAASIGENGVFFEEYAFYPAAHVLNGYLLAIFGLYDYVSLRDESQITELIHRSLVTLHVLLDRFDMGYWSYYDLLLRIPATLFYHSLHITLLEALVQYTGCEHCAALAERWTGYQHSRSSKVRYFLASRIARYRRGLQRLFIRTLTPKIKNKQVGILIHKLMQSTKMSSSDVLVV